jgi:glutaminyl-peptide cyclotransferase
MRKNFFIALSLSLVVVACNTDSAENEEITNETPVLTYKIIGCYPHDIQSFTEGLYVDNGQIFESTGSPEDLAFTQSHFGILDTLTGKIKVKASLDKSIYFGEGIAKLSGKIFQLTYKSKTCFVYDAKNYKKINQYTFENAEGWGLTHDSTSLIMSDGTNKLTYFSPKDFTKIKELNIRENSYAVNNINELEYVDGSIYANIWQTNQIIKIDAKTGNVIAKTDLGQLVLDAQKGNPGLMEMNGIAYDAVNKEFLLTGKLWPKVYVLKIN